MGNQATIGGRFFVAAAIGLLLVEGTVIGFIGGLVVLMWQGIVASHGTTWSAAALGAILAVATVIGRTIGFLSGWRLTWQLRHGVRILEHSCEDR
jgi:hypothetical protein